MTTLVVSAAIKPDSQMQLLRERTELGRGIRGCYLVVLSYLNDVTKK